VKVERIVVATMSLANGVVVPTDGSWAIEPTVHVFEGMTVLTGVRVVLLTPIRDEVPA